MRSHVFVESLDEINYAIARNCLNMWDPSATGASVRGISRWVGGAVRGLGFGVWGLGYGVWGLVFGV